MGGSKIWQNTGATNPDHLHAQKARIVSQNIITIIFILEIFRVNFLVTFRLHFSRNFDFILEILRLILVILDVFIF